ncbi:unnamed protein product [Dibothriocephalus latus]|uniref:BRCT domain-containing protein n=1 Tax=Dibothriocephalus latus TaxID=60516 RepID=A0A3P7M236_DIBLA|nr:unnamed protein product [Dibothriocephalus latus]
METPLHDAVTNAHLPCCKLLLKYGANPEVPNALGLSPLNVCANMLERLKRPAKPNVSSILDKLMTNRSNGGTILAACELTRTIYKLRLSVRFFCRIENSSIKLVQFAPVAVATEESALKPKSEMSYLLVGSGSISSQRRLRPVLLGTGLSRIQRTQFVRVASLLHARVATEMSPEVTHLVTGAALSPQSDNQKKKPSKGGDKVYPNESNCPRTLKFLSAVLQGCWILAFDWIETCSFVKSRVEEEGFELPGCSTAPITNAPRKARQAREAGSAGLFHGFRLCLLVSWCFIFLCTFTTRVFVYQKYPLCFKNSVSPFSLSLV